MKIHFYNSTPGQNPAERFLFIDDYALIKEGDKVNNSGRNFQIKQLSWIENKPGQLKAICTEVPGPTKIFNDGTRPHQNI